MVPNSLCCERVIPIFVHGKINKKENHVFSSILNSHNRAVQSYLQVPTVDKYTSHMLKKLYGEVFVFFFILALPPSFDFLSTVSLQGYNYLLLQ